MRTTKLAGILIGFVLAALAIVIVVTVATTIPASSSFAGLESSGPGIHPCWSPDGTMILYSCLEKSKEFVDKRSTTAELAAWDPRDNRTRRIKVGHELQHHWDLYWPQWSDRKDRIFVTGARASGEDVPDWMTKSLIIRERLLGKSEWVVELDTGERRLLFHFPYGASPASVRWNPGVGFGLWRVRFVNDRSDVVDQKSIDIVQTDEEGFGQDKYTAYPMPPAYNHDVYSARRGALVYSESDGTGEHAKYCLYILNGSNGQAEPVTDFIEQPIQGVALSPDDKRIAYALASSAEMKREPARLLVRDVKSGAETEIADDIWGFTRFSWSPDGTAIAYTSAKDAKIHIVAVPDDLGTRGR